MKYVISLKSLLRGKLYFITELTLNEELKQPQDLVLGAKGPSQPL